VESAMPLLGGVTPKYRDASKGGFSLFPIYTQNNPTLNKDVLHISSIKKIPKRKITSGKIKPFMLK
jgi:hypothetical protein